MQHIRNHIKAAREGGIADALILEHLANRPSRDQLADLKAAAGPSGPNTAKTMARLIQAVLDEPEQPEWVGDMMKDHVP